MFRQPEGRAAGAPSGPGEARPGAMEVRDLGRRAYRPVWELQRSLVEQRVAGEGRDTLLVVEHEPVVTTGRGTAEDFLLEKRFEVVPVERGGEATWHGPGQIVVYPIVRLAPGRRDLHAWMRALEQACMDALEAFGLNAGRREGATGVWVGEGQRKIVSIGVAASRWVTYHGLALNHETDLSVFEAIRPCGFEASVMTSMRAELGPDRCPARSDVTEELVRHLHQSLDGFRVSAG